MAEATTTGADPLGRLQRFLRSLRDNGLRVTQQEAMDAFRGLELLGAEAFADRGVLRAALKATLTKHPAEEAIFDRVFDLTFGRAPSGGLGPDLVDALLARGLDRAQAEDLAERLRSELGAEGKPGLARSLLDGDADQVQDRIREALEETETGGLSSPLQVGYFSQRLLHQLGFDDVEAQLARARDRLEGGEGAARGLIDERLLALRRMARAATRSELEKKQARGDHPDRDAALAERSFRSLSAAEQRRMKELIRRMAERLKSRVHRREARKRRGRLDVRRTLRSSLATEGVPVRPAFTRRRRERPEIVLVCDISDSVRTASAFMLHFVYAVQDLFHRVRTFVFVDHLGEVTDLFASTSVDEAIERVLLGDAVSVFANSDYGQAFRELAGEHLESLNRRTTFVVLGDGRTNYAAPEAWVLGEVRRRVRHVLWLCPEPQGTWGAGDSVMPIYARACDEVHVVRSVADLARAVDKLVL